MRAPLFNFSFGYRVCFLLLYGILRDSGIEQGNEASQPRLRVFRDCFIRRHVFVSVGSDLSDFFIGRDSSSLVLSTGCTFSNLINCGLPSVVLVRERCRFFEEERVGHYVRLRVHVDLFQVVRADSGRFLRVREVRRICYCYAFFVVGSYAAGLSVRLGTNGERSSGEVQRVILST